jgi:hypothetical protein
VSFLPGRCSTMSERPCRAIRAVLPTGHCIVIYPEPVDLAVPREQLSKHLQLAFKIHLWRVVLDIRSGRCGGGAWRCVLRWLQGAHTYQ